MNISKIFTLTFFILLLALSIVGVYHIVPQSKLYGSYVKPPEPNISIESWFDGEAQSETDLWIKDNFGLKTTFVKIYNQINYSLFNVVKSSVFLGKDGYIFEKSYIEADNGEDYIGDSLILANSIKLSQVSDTLQKLNKQLIVVLAPSKICYLNDHVPNKMINKVDKTNYEEYKKAFNDHNISVVDVNEWFKTARDTTSIPLFPKTGTHWSVYGAGLVADSLVDLISEKRDTIIPDFELYNINKTDDLIEVDTDIENLLNLLLPLNRYPLAYPKSRVTAEVGAEKPRLTVISDSFFWNIFNYYSLHVRVFEHIKFYYYNKTIYPDSYKKRVAVKDVFLQNQIDSTDVYVIMGSTASMFDIGWDFIDNMWENFYGESQDESKEMQILIAKYKKQILSSEKWRETIRKKAKEKKLSIDETLYREARWMAKKEMEKK